LSEKLIIKEIMEESRKFLKVNENENTTHQNFGTLQRQCEEERL
jgi:hypothetical protein